MCGVLAVCEGRCALEVETLGSAALVEKVKGAGWRRFPGGATARPGKSAGPGSAKLLHTSSKGQQLRAVRTLDQVSKLCLAWAECCCWTAV